jgi:uncharacterized lipoprotein YddW (UPF0748 family)
MLMTAHPLALRVRAALAALILGLLTTLLPLNTAHPAAQTRSLASALPPPPPPAAELREPRGEVRALWVTRSALATPDQVTRLVQDARDAGFNTLLVQVRGRGDAWFLNGLEPRAAALAGAPATFDPLAQTLTQAHAAGLRVHAWVNVNLVASVALMPHEATHLVNLHPDWLMVPRPLAHELSGMDPRRPQYVARLAAWSRNHASTIEGLYASPIPIEAAHYLEAIVRDLAARYPIDGLHLDYVRYPTSDFDYSAGALTAFRASLIDELSTPERARLEARRRTDPLVYVNTFPERWTKYRRTRLTDLVARLRAAVKKERPNALISAAVKPDAREAANERLQDWQDWAARGLLDVICPMAYTPNLPQFARTVTGAGRSAAPQQLWAGIGAYRLDSAQTVAHIQAARAAGAQGIALFSYDSLTGPALRTIGRTAFGDAAVAVASTH